jgi:biopolymer transport protein ExbD
MDMTPMVDVTFLLLIFFMVTAAFSLQRSMQVPTPRPEEPSTNVQVDPREDADTVTVHVDEFNTYRVVTTDWDVEAPSDQELLIKLREARQGNSQGVKPTKLRVMANVEALHKNVIRAMDAGSSVGMQEVQLQIVEENE